MLISVEDQYPWKDDGSPFNGNTCNMRFRNVTVEGRQGKISIIKGKDADNGHRDFLFENLTIDGVTVTEANKDAYFEMNGYARSIRFGLGAGEALNVATDSETARQRKAAL